MDLVNHTLQWFGSSFLSSNLRPRMISSWVTARPKPMPSRFRDSEESWYRGEMDIRGIPGGWIHFGWIRIYADGVGVVFFWGGFERWKFVAQKVKPFKRCELWLHVLWYLPHPFLTSIPSLHNARTLSSHFPPSHLCFLFLIFFSP